ncbi:MAG TPA: NADH-quinone oxidoreductase subunit NuoG [Nitrosomonas sp.]|nr:NADH-quinone oxidoreductase subunit NuoG [Nitrosomonas sp.]HMW20469.1 NADH-quinone oxidoreductase subunit NuoG [Nitrosomonas sp.]HMY61906.1 NADH-quinone oxidoreductase subunit NuoG [Nitrosomonas sp.]HMY89149.1 NADH-quinone oxidoreductase subunit NuoG [Nitrosomonas sp.]HNA69439.1 NADH-quinone oxidoreductase subunit NuoG [Nitrosomonas sp.]
MINIEINGKQLEVPKGSTVMDAAKQLGIYIPHFCYHKKLSIAANCRMCLVQIEKAPKPLPACATPATEGMKIFTHSDQAVLAQKGVMEFLLINHPLDCPICDQGGECQLQDLAVGYGESASRYQEAKRVVTNKNLGPLISTDMTRCIHCTRCVRFGQEIAGIMELGMSGRGEHSEILSFVGKTVDSELSGNVIDLCPVGALVSKPFRYSARTWELSRRKSISPHCGLGSNLIVQVKQNRVMRILPRENEEINECWLSDKDRFSYEGLNSEDRLSKPMIKRNNQWITCDWQEALLFVVQNLKACVSQYGGRAIGALGSPHSTLEELYLLQKLVRGLGSNNIDHRLRQSDFRADNYQQGIPWLGMPIAEVSNLKSILIIGSNLRKDHPLLALRVRQAVKSGAQLSIVNSTDDDLLTKVAQRAIVAPSELVRTLAQILKAIIEYRYVEIADKIKETLTKVNVTDVTKAIANNLVSNQSAGIFLGNLSQHHPNYSEIFLLAQEIAKVTSAKLGVFGEAANSVGAYVAGAIPNRKLGNLTTNGEEVGLNAIQMLNAEAVSACKAYILVNLEPEYDTYDPQSALERIKGAEFVVSLSSYKGNITDYADVILPIAPFTETSGTFINTEGRVQSFNGVVSPLAEARPAWKVLRVLANLLELKGFDYETSEQVCTELLSDYGNVADHLNNRINEFTVNLNEANVNGIERIGEVNIYQSDPIVRRASSLQLTRDAHYPRAIISPSLMEKLGLRVGDKITIKQGVGESQLEVEQSESIPDNCIRIASAFNQTATLGGMFGEVSVKRM